MGTTLDIDALESRAACLTHPASGIANDFLNTFNEIFLLIQNMPVLLPEMIEDLQRWKPQTYREYFANSPLPGGKEALITYDTVDPEFRDVFEERVQELSNLALQSKHVILSFQTSDGEIDPDSIGDTCDDLANRFGQALAILTEMVNTGNVVPLDDSPRAADVSMNSCLGAGRGG